jgi:hypothetical protein
MLQRTVTDYLYRVAIVTLSIAMHDHNSAAAGVEVGHCQVGGILCKMKRGLGVCPVEQRNILSGTKYVLCHMQYY